MCVTFSQIKTVPSAKSGDKSFFFFLYPNLVIVEGGRAVRIVNIQAKNEDSTHLDRLFELDQDILDQTLIEHLLWIILKSGELHVINVQTCCQMRIKSDNYANYKISRLRNVGEVVYLLSEGGESLKVPLSTKQLNEKNLEGTTEIMVTFEKERIPIPQDSNKRLADGLYAYINSTELYVECPITGLHQAIESNVQLEHIVPWSDVALVANKSGMWILDIKDCNVLFSFDKASSNYYPIAAHDNAFYYLLLDEKEVQIFCAWNSSAVSEEQSDIDDSNKRVTKLSQDNLKSQMQYLMHSAVTNSTDPEQVSQQLKPFIEQIEDLAFLLQNVSTLCQHNIAYKFVLHPLQKRVYLTDDKNLISQLVDLIAKVDLLEYILFRGITTYDTVNLFQQNYKQLCVTFISKSDLDLASLCWLKYSESISNILPEDVVEILNAVPHNIKMGALVIWLRNFVPTLLDQNPYFIDIFVKWTTERTFLLENSNYWPKIGLKFVDEIVTVLEKSLKTIIIRPISVDDLDVLKDHINYIIELKEKYKINMLLGELSSQSHNEVALIMLRRCYNEDLEAFLVNFLATYATRFLFEIDDILRSFIEYEAASCGGGIDSCRLKILVNSLRSPTIKMECLLQVLKVLDVPWDDTVVNLAISVAGSIFKDFTITDKDRQLAQEIQLELNYAKVKVVLKKYNFPMSCTDYTLVLHKLINATTVDLEDLRVICSILPTYTNYGAVLYVDRCLRDCNTKAALHFFNDLAKKEKKILLKTIMAKYEQVIAGNKNSKDPGTERNYLDFLKGTKLLNDIQIKNVENLYHLKNSYNETLSVNAMYDEQYCTKKTKEWIDNGGITESSGRGRCLAYLTRTHQFGHSELVSLLQRTSTSNRVRKIIENLFMSNPHTKDDSLRTDLRGVLSHFKDGRNSPLLLESFEVLIELLTKCSEEHVQYLIKNISILNALINTNIIVKNLSITWKFNYIFSPLLSVHGNNDLIEFYCTIPGQKDDTKYNMNLSKNDFMAFRLLSYSMASPGFSEMSSELMKVKENAARRLISKITASQDIDEVLLTCLLLILNGVDDAEDKIWILDVLQGQSDSLQPAVMDYLSSSLIRHAFGLDTILPESVNSYPPQYILKSKFNINMAEVALPDNTEETWDVKIILFYVLRQFPDTTFERLVELCRTLNVSVNHGLSLQLIALLTTWELKYKVYNDEWDCRHICLENDEKDMISKCFTIWESIREKSFLSDVLHDFWKNGEVTLHGRLIITINPYYYEVYMCIHHLICSSFHDSRNKREYFLLNFLKEYRRRSSPKQYEFELFSVKGMFPEIGHYRLPFHLFMREDMWSNLKSEITLETYERWLPAVVLLSLDADLQTAKDMICSNALKQTMTTRKSCEVSDEETNEKERWRLTAQEEPLLRAAHRCVSHIANMEWAGACLFYVLQGCARGADQVAAAQLCYQFAQRWAALQPGNRAVRQMERLHSSLSTRHALYKIEWACEELVRLSAEPTQLIRAMYLHPSFIEKMSRHDVNRAANEIADKNGISISSIRIQILENILSRTQEENKTNANCGLDTKKLMIAKYILKATCPKMGAIYLSRIAFDDDSDFNTCKKLRALQCLMSVVEQDTAVKVANRGRDDFWSSLLELLYVVNLEDIDMPWLVATVIQNKSLALEQLIQTTGGNIEGLKLSAELARRFGNTHLIRELIPALLRVGLYEEVVPLLLKLSSPPDELIYSAWRAVIMSPFQRADYPITDRQKTKCINAVNLLPVCPIIKDEDLIEIWKNCVRCKCFGLGCLVLPYITPLKRQSLIELKKIDRRNLISSLKNLHSETFLISGAMTVLEGLSSKTYKLNG